MLRLWDLRPTNLLTLKRGQWARCGLVLCLLLAGGAGSAGAQTTAVPIGSADDFGVIIDATIAPGGDIVVADYSNQEVTLTDPEGRQVWRSGRKGNGPGEFTGLYRVSVAPSGKIFAFDVGTNSVSVLSQRGDFEIRHRLPVYFAQVDALVALNDTTVLIAGVTFSQGQASRAAIHRFRLIAETADYAGSFGPLPVARDPEALRYWGAGGISIGRDGQRVYYTRKLPYEIHVFDNGGSESFSFRAPFVIDRMPDDSYQITDDGKRKTIRAEAGVPRPIPAIQTPGGLLLSGRNDGITLRWDLFASDGTLLGSFTPPASWRGRIGFSPAGDILWLVLSLDDVPRLAYVEWKPLRSQILLNHH